MSMHDKSLCHMTTRRVSDVFIAKGVQVVPQLRNSSDLNPTENVRHYVKGRVRACQEIADVHSEHAKPSFNSDHS